MIEEKKITTPKGGQVEKKTITPKAKTGKFIYGKGSRKASTASIRLYKKGKGSFEVNGKKYTDYFRTETLQKIFLGALNLTNHLKDIDITIKVAGGGQVGQAEACRHGMARALIEMDPQLRPALKAEGFLRRDPRVKERKKPGLKGARRAPQWSKR